MTGLALALVGAAYADTPVELPTYPTARAPAHRYGTTAYRTAIPAGPPSASARVAFVQDLDGASIGELTLRGSAAWQGFGVAVESAGTAAASELWSSAGLGNTVVDARGLFGRKATHALGLRVTIPTGALIGAGDPIAWWGTVPEVTIPMVGVALVYGMATPRIVWQVRAGLRYGNWYFGSSFFDAAGSIATVQPLAPGWDVVLEMELLISPSPLQLRALARRDLGHGWEADLGLAIPVPAMVTDPTLQVIGRVERSW